MRKYIIIGGVLLLLAGMSYLIGLKHSFVTKHESYNASVVIEQVKKVAKMVSVEADVSEIYAHKDYLTWDISPLRKKALVRINAKILAGFDFEKMAITIDSINNKVLITYIPPSEILAIDHNLDYYDITEGTFNSFDAEDYNNINHKAKKIIEEKAISSNILAKADAHKEEMINMLRILLQAMGYELEIKRLPTPGYRG
jgi:hypothetical protein